ncbi:MAG TPA: ABC transporter ATP-binding protein, partial [Mesotoga infera]|nr:ABC transporter ATP-binding protein [Mesotoga infera]
MVDPIQIRDLHFSYGKEEVLSGIDLELRHGEVLG